MNRRDLLIKGLGGAAAMAALPFVEKLPVQATNAHAGGVVWWHEGDGPELLTVPEGSWVERVETPDSLYLVYAQNYKLHGAVEYALLEWSDGMSMYVDRPVGLFHHPNKWLTEKGTFVWWNDCHLSEHQMTFEQEHWPAIARGKYVDRNEERFEQVIRWYADGAPSIEGND